MSTVLVMPASTEIDPITGHDEGAELNLWTPEGIHDDVNGDDVAPPDPTDDASDAPPLDDDAGVSDVAEFKPLSLNAVVEQSSQAGDTDDPWFRDQMARISNAELDCIRAESRLESLKQDAKEAKEHLEGCILRLRSLCRETRQEQERAATATASGEKSAYPLFDGAGAGNADQGEGNTDPTEATADAAPADSTPPTDPDDLSWREVELGELAGISMKMLDKLYAAGLITVGDLADYTATDTGWSRLSENIPGVGPSAVAKIEEAMSEFWRGRNAGATVAVQVEAVDHAVAPQSVGDDLLE